MAKRGIPAVADWKRLLLTRKTDAGPVLRSIAANAITIIANDPAWVGVVAYDEFAETIVTRRVPPWRPQDMPPDATAGDWTDEDTLRMQAWLADAYALDIGLEATLGAVKVAAARARFHPVREWLQGLKWDGVRRVSGWLTPALGCDATPYTREVGNSFLIGAVARIMRPGCKLDTAPIFEGETGTFKSSAIRALAGDEWFLEMSITDVASKDAMQVLRRKWIAEIPEFDGLSKSEAAHVKAYFSRQVDTYRPSYGKGSRDFPRQTAFLASTNKDQYLVDETGGRRFHPLKCRVANLALIREIREQLWGEAVALYESGVAWHVTDPMLGESFRAEQDARYRPHPWEEKIAAWLERPIDLPAGKLRSELGVTTSDVLAGLGLEVTKWTQRDANDAAACLRRLGWRQAPQSRRNGVRVRLFFPANSADSLTADSDSPHPDEAPSGVHELADTPIGWPDDADLASLHGE